MNLLAISNWKTKTAGYTLLLSGLFAGSATLFAVLGSCIDGSFGVAVCVQKLPEAFAELLSAAGGLGFLGIGHKAQRLHDEVLRVETLLLNMLPKP